MKTYLKTNNDKAARQGSTSGMTRMRERGGPQPEGVSRERRGGATSRVSLADSQDFYHPACTRGFVELRERAVQTD